VTDSAVTPGNFTSSDRENRKRRQNWFHIDKRRSVPETDEEAHEGARHPEKDRR